MKFFIDATYDNVDKYNLSNFNLTKDKNGEHFIEINTLEEMVNISKVTNHPLVIFTDIHMHWNEDVLKENGCDGAIEIYNGYRE